MFGTQTCEYLQRFVNVCMFATVTFNVLQFRFDFFFWETSAIVHLNCGDLALDLEFSFGNWVCSATDVTCLTNIKSR